VSAKVSSCWYFRLADCPRVFPTVSRRTAAFAGRRRSDGCTRRTSNRLATPRSEIPSLPPCQAQYCQASKPPVCPLIELCFHHLCIRSFRLPIRATVVAWTSDRRATSSSLPTLYARTTTYLRCSAPPRRNALINQAALGHILRTGHLRVVD
jgi:hypothetical protein